MGSVSHKTKVNDATQETTKLFPETRDETRSKVRDDHSMENIQTKKVKQHSDCLFHFFSNMVYYCMNDYVAIRGGKANNKESEGHVGPGLIKNR